jgi:hypothetical protein
MLIFISGFVTAQDTIVVKTFTYDSTSRDAVFEFPDNINETYHKIIMEYGMRCHDLVVGNGSEGCREWDYSCNTIIYDSTRTDSILVDDGNGNLVYQTSSPVRYEIMSFVTPYGNGLDLGPEGKMWQFDVTDFGPILRGKKRIALVGGGQNQEEMAITFKFITGTPVREVLDIRPIWPHKFSANVNQIADDILFEPRNLSFPRGTDQVKLRTIVTGHGQTGEFSSFQHSLNVNDGEAFYPYSIWTECSDIPVYPQGGTWLFDRAGWCPGDPSTVHEFFPPADIVSRGSMEVDYNIKDIRNVAEARYIVNNQVVFYGENNFENDAEVLAIHRPSPRIEFGRFNPICMKPQVEIRNNGTRNLTATTITYGVEGEQQLTYDWTGDLAEGETDTIDLDYPEEVFLKLNGPSRFVAEISGDDYEANDRKASDIELADAFEGRRVLLLLTTNRAPDDNELTLTDADGNEVLKYTDLEGSRSYFDEVELDQGCYRITLTDLSDDGLYYWFYERNGVNRGEGGLQLFVDDDEVKVFEPEFGRFVQYEFVVGNTTATRGQTLSRLRVYPNPTSDKVIIEAKNLNRDVSLRLFDMDGQLIKTWQRERSEERLEWQLTDLLPGMYILELESSGRTTRERIIIQ